MCTFFHHTGPGFVGIKPRLSGLKPITGGNSCLVLYGKRFIMARELTGPWGYGVGVGDLILFVALLNGYAAHLCLCAYMYV